jgi:hypothetical protein
MATAGAESAGAKAKGFATMNRGERFTVLVRALRGMP